MSMGAGSATLEQMLEPVTRCFNLDVARVLLGVIGLCIKKKT